MIPPKNLLAAIGGMWYLILSMTFKNYQRRTISILLAIALLLIVISWVVRKVNAFSLSSLRDEAEQEITQEVAEQNVTLVNLVDPEFIETFIRYEDKHASWDRENFPMVFHYKILTTNILKYEKNKPFNHLSFNLSSVNKCSE